ncbi:MAG: MBL fold metallo-hydrolase [Acidobacteria bacterium]|nr:MBL fold metallo-hydrolase [Acidobacteriota bacterium]
MKTIFPIACACLCLAQDSQIQFKVTKLTEGIHMLEGIGGFTGGNLGLLSGDDGLVLIDDSMANYSSLMLDALAKINPQPIDFVINTHVHGDHIGGNEVLAKSGTTVVAHQHIRDRMLKEGIQGADGMVPAPKDVLPELTFSDSVTFHLNGHDAFVFHVAKAHTDGDAVIHFVDANIIHAGDLFFNGMFPFIDLDSGGTVAGYIAGQERILSLCNEETRIIPGHGALATRADLERDLSVLKTIDQRIKNLAQAGKTEAEILAANPLEDYHDQYNWVFITTERMVKTLTRTYLGP